MKRWLPTGILLAILAFVVLRPPAEGEPVLRRDFPAMGTWISLSVYYGASERRSAAEQWLTEAEQQFHSFDRQWSPHGDGALGRYNQQLLEGAKPHLPSELRALIELSDNLRERSHGLFDGRLAGLIELWGFDQEANFRQQPPADDAITSWRRQHDEERTAQRWNLGAIAKGELVDRTISQAREAGFDHVLINAGGNLGASGRHGDRAWRVAIRHPRPSKDQRLLATFEPRNEAVITSGDYERYFEYQGQRFHHILDPRTGYPARGLRSVTVVHESAALADAASTALFVAGRQWRELARQLALETVLVVTDEGALEATPTAAQRIQLSGGLQPTVLP